MALTFQREPGLTAADYVGIVGRTSLGVRRPLANETRIQAMLDGANFIVGARDDGELVGLARCLTDFAWVCYVAELAVKDSHQGRGIGKHLLETCADLLGPAIGLTLVGDPEAVPFYRHIGMQPYDGFFRDRSISD